MHWFSVENHIGLVATLLDLGAQVDPVNNYDSTPLLEAVQLGHTEISELLLSRGADVKHKNSCGQSVISGLINLKRHASLASLLLSHIPPEEPLTDYADITDLVGLRYRKDAVALLFQERGLPDPPDYLID